MNSRRIVLALPAALVLVSAGATGPAHADSITDNAVGTYTIGWKPDTPSATWVFTPCEGDTPRCVAINQYGLADTQMKKPSFIGNAYWTVGSWVMVTHEKNLIVCKDTGQKFGSDATWAWDAAGNQGGRSYIDPGLCGEANKGKDVTSKFFLNKVGPEAPVPAPASVTPPAPAQPPVPSPAPAQPPVPGPPGAAESSAPPPAA